MRKLTHDEIAEIRGKNLIPPADGRLPLVAIVDNVRSLYNVGSIFRTSDGAAIAHLYLTGYTPHPPRKEIDKTALGATRSVPWTYMRTTAEAIDHCRALGYRIAALELTNAGRPVHQATPEHFPLCLVVGNEITGVSDNVLAAADLAYDIPMYGAKQSLNVAVAYGIAVFTLGHIWRDVRPHSSKARVK